jgi:hypothetical protein
MLRFCMRRRSTTVQLVVITGVQRLRALAGAIG